MNSSARLASIWGTRPGAAWVLPSAFFATVAFALLLSQGAIVNFAYTPLALAAAIVLYRAHPPVYLSFVYWLWLTTPFFRRVVDYQSEFHVLSPVLLAPVAASALCALTIVRASRHLHIGRYVPVTMILLVLLYGLFVGIVLNGLFAAVFAFLTWLGPISVAVYILVHHDQAKQLTASIVRTMCVGALVVGAYGIFQFYVAPEWDTFWMWEADMASIGNPYPGEIRVFSTLNAPAPMAAVLGACLLVLIAQRGLLNWITMLTTASSFMLSLVRSAWGAFGLAGLFVLFLANSQLRMRFLGVTAAAGAISAMVISSLPNSHLLVDRFSTLVSLEDDKSYQVRSDLIATVIERALTAPFGSGLGATGNSTRLGTGDASLGHWGVFDNGLLDLFSTFGWAAMIMLLGLGLFLSRGLRAARGNEPATLAVVVAISVLAQLIFVNTLTGVTGMFALPMLALAVLQTEADQSRLASEA